MPKQQVKDAGNEELALKKGEKLDDVVALPLKSFRTRITISFNLKVSDESICFV